MTGVIKEVNSKLSDEPGLLNKSPEDNGECHAPYASHRLRGH